MPRTMISVAFALVVAGATVAAPAAPCKDARGKFVKCPPTPARPVARCKNAKGHFARCGTPGAKPM